MANKTQFLTRLTVVVSVGLTISIVFMAVSLAVRRSTHTTVKAQESWDLSTKVAQLSSALREEQRVAVDFVSYINSTLSEADTLAPLRAATARTQGLLSSILSSVGDDDVKHLDAIRPAQVLEPSQLFGFQRAVRRRSVSASEILEFYSGALTRSDALMAKFAGVAVFEGEGRAFASMSCALFANDLAVAAAVAEASNTSTVIDEASFIQIARGLRAATDLYDSRCYGVIPPELRDQFSIGKTGEDTIESIQQAMLTSSFTVANPTQGSTEYEAASDNQAAVVKQVEDRAGDVDTSVWWYRVAATSTGIAAAAIALVLAVARCLVTLLYVNEERNEESVLRGLEMSLERMEEFITGVVSMRMKDLSSTDAKLIQPVEHEVYGLEAPTKQLLSFVHPAVTQYQMSNPQVTNTLASFLMVDLNRLHAKATSESVKQAPQMVQTMLTTIGQFVAENNGIIHDIAGSKLVCAWNLTETCYDSMSVACQAAQAIVGHYEKQDVRVSVVTGQVSMGFNTSDTMKMFCATGDVLNLGALLLRLCKLHSVQMILDHATFSKLDAQAFKTRPLELVSLSPSHPPTTAFELLTSTVQEKDGRSLAWNEAFESYKQNQFERAKILFRQWSQNFGGNPSVMRMLNIVTDGIEAGDAYPQCTNKAEGMRWFQEGLQ